jgi:hypothetical protein
MRAKYSDHEVFQKPTNENSRIWRYMNFTKFVSLLEMKALFFCRSDKLGDPFEGSLSQANVRLRPIVYKGKIPDDMLKVLPTTFKEIRRFTIINCWNLSECESAALWNLYVKNNEGVAIQSTFSRLKQCFDSQEDQPVFLGKVKYIDYKNEWLPEGNLLFPFMHKRRSFEHEQELRAIIMKFPTTSFNIAPDIFDQGEYVEVNLNTLIENVYVSPTSSEWFKKLVESVMKKYELDFTPVRSDLDDAPVY